MYYILHGDEDLERAEKVAELRRQVQSDGMGDLNVTILDGRQSDLSELINACNTLPFLTNRRLVIVYDLLQREEPADGAPREGRRPSLLQGLLEYLPHLPSSTRLLLVESRALSANHPLLKACRESKDCYVREFRRPTDAELPGWIQRRAELKKLRLERGTAALLGQWVGSDLRTLDHELDKLGAYVDYARPIAGDDVRALVSRVYDDDIFALVDALGLRQGKRAMHLLEDMLAAGENELRLLSMIARQVRLILAAKELSEERKVSAAEMQRALGVRDFVAAKLRDQARQFSMAALQRAHRLVLETEQAIKTGAMDAQLALELLVLQISARSAT